MKISIPKPCNEDWSKMIPNGQGAFCARCCKTVLDLTSKTRDEIVSILSQGKKVCAKIKKSHLEFPVLSPFMRGRMRVFACALMLAFGTTLFSCGNDHTVGEVATPVTGDSVLLDPAVMDTSAVKSNASDTQAVSHTPVSTIAKTSQDTAKKNKVTVKPQEPGEVQEQPQQGGPHPLPLEPRWAGGNKTELQQYISSQVKYPEEAKKNNIKGTVMVSFIVKTDGTAKDFKIFRGLGYGCDEEAIRVAKLIKWEPGKQNGKVVDMEYNAAVPFGE